MKHKQIRIVLEREARSALNRLLVDGNTPQKIVKRARMSPNTAEPKKRSPW